MPEIKQSKTLPYPAKDIYNLIIDIEKYPEFLPWCKDAKIIGNVSESQLHADLLINFKGFLKKYRSDVLSKISNGDYVVDIKAIEGPFKKLTSHWKINTIDDSSCEVEFFVDFEFNSNLLSKIIGVIFEKANHKMMNAFEERAKEIYPADKNSNNNSKKSK
jgi:coenzyme Q-binding protein COQ10